VITSPILVTPPHRRRLTSGSRASLSSSTSTVTFRGPLLRNQPTRGRNCQRGHLATLEPQVQGSPPKRRRLVRDALDNFEQQTLNYIESLLCNGILSPRCLGELANKYGPDSDSELHQGEICAAGLPSNHIPSDQNENDLRDGETTS
jgi:hypothetical protein